MAYNPSLEGDVGPEGRFFSGADVYQGYFQTAMVKVVVGRSPHLQTFYAHEGVLSKSPFFERALNGGFKESTTYEVELPEDDPKIFSSVLEYLYNGEYSPRLIAKVERNGYLSNESKVISGYKDVEERPAQQGAAALRHAKIYCLADKFVLEGLQKLVLEKLCLCGPVKDVYFIRVAAYLVENSSNTGGVLSAFLSPYVEGIPKS